MIRGAAASLARYRWQPCRNPRAKEILEINQSLRCAHGGPAWVLPGKTDRRRQFLPGAAFAVTAEAKMIYIDASGPLKAH
jgi:hypothetical protein